MLYTLEELYNKKEDQTFDRKSARKDPKGLSNHIVAFANADGGTLVIGIEDDSTVTGIDGYQNNINDIPNYSSKSISKLINKSSQSVQIIIVQFAFFCKFSS